MGNDPQLHEKEKPIIYTASGEPVVIKRPFGFAGHPAAQHENSKEVRNVSER